MEFELYEMEAEEGFEKALKHYENNLAKVNAGQANPAILNAIKIDYYETMTPLNEIAGISSPEPRQLLIKPFDQSVTKQIVATINKSSLGVQAIDEGNQARITIPQMTQDRRRDLIKSFGGYTEEAKVQIRGVRQNVNKQIKNDDELSEDQEKGYLEDIQKLVHKYTAKVDEMAKVKEKELNTI